MNTKTKILEAAIHLFSKNGIRNTSLREIADEVGIKKPSLYNHFNSKDDLVKQLYTTYRDKALKHNTTSIKDVEEYAVAHNAKETLILVVTSYVNLYSGKESGMLWQLVYSEQFYDRTAYEIVIEETERMISATAGLLEVISAENTAIYRSDEEIKNAASMFAYGIKALLVENILKEKHGDTNSDFTNKIKSFCIVFADNILKDN